MLTRIAVACALTLSACNIPGTSDMPGLNDEAALKATVLRLNPIAPGGDPNYTGHFGTGQPHSERGLFTAYLRRYLEDDAIARQNIDYKPAPLARTVAEAIEDQRRYEAQQQQREADEMLQQRRADAAREARNQVQNLPAPQQQAAQQAAQDQYLADRQAEDAKRAANFAECDRQRQAAQTQQSPDEESGATQLQDCERVRDQQLSDDRMKISNAM